MARLASAGLFQTAAARAVSWLVIRPDQYTDRAVRNSVAEAWHGQEDALRRNDAERAHYAEAAAQGDADIAVVFAGEGVDLIDAVEPAAAILDRIIERPRRRSLGHC